MDNLCFSFSVSNTFYFLKSTTLSSLVQIFLVSITTVLINDIVCISELVNKKFQTHDGYPRPGDVLMSYEKWETDAKFDRVFSISLIRFAPRITGRNKKDSTEN